MTVNDSRLRSRGVQAPDLDPDRARDLDVVAGADEVETVELTAMASAVVLRVVRPGRDAAVALAHAEATIRDVERTCSRFDPTSALSLVNAAPDQWHVVPETLARAITEAARAHRETRGLFDPRILDVLLSWGYDRSLPFAGGGVDRGPTGIPAFDPPHDGALTPPWQPQVAERDGTWNVHLGGTPIDLGGIGKGLAVRWAASALAGAGSGSSVDIGGDCAFAGIAPDGGGWRVGVEDPSGRTPHVLVLEVTDTGCATSSTRLRRWRANGVPVHHLVDPRTRRPGGEGLAAVTVVATDPAWSEVWSKTLFLAGADGIRARADELGLAAAWVCADGSGGADGSDGADGPGGADGSGGAGGSDSSAGTVGTSAAMDPLVIWRRTDG